MSVCDCVYAATIPLTVGLAELMSITVYLSVLLSTEAFEKCVYL